MNRKQKRIQRRKKDIITIGARLFSSIGYEATTLDMIADELGLSKTGLYYYIQSKEEVLVKIHEDIVQSLIDQVPNCIDPNMPPDEQLRRLIVAHVTTLCSHPGRRVIALYRSYLLREHAQEVTPLRDQYQKIIEDIILAGIEQGIFHIADAKLAAFALLGALNWVPGWYSPEGPLSLTEIGQSFASILIGGLISPYNASITPKLNGGKISDKRTRNRKQRLNPPNEEIALC